MYVTDGDKTRNRVVLTGTWVRIPPSPPLAGFLLQQKPRFFFGHFLETLIYLLHPTLPLKTLPLRLRPNVRICSLLLNSRYA